MHKWFLVVHGDVTSYKVKDCTYANKFTKIKLLKITKKVENIQYFC